MKWLIPLIVLSLFAFSSCKCCKSGKNNKTNVVAAIGTHMGMVSHQYRATGCKTVVIINGDEGVTLIPVEGLPDSLDMDGKLIKFDYTTLRMPQPEGCNTGLPASLTNVTEVLGN